MDLFVLNFDFDNNNCLDFVYDDGGYDYNWSLEIIFYFEDKGIKFIKGFNLQFVDENVSNIFIFLDVLYFFLNDE